MKELTYENWLKNPTPRMMWVWDDDEKDKVKRKVVYVVKGGPRNYPVRTTTNDDTDYEAYTHCAEIESKRRMTNRELARWIREKPTRECKWTFDGCICSVHTYNEKCENEEVHKGVVIRENDGEWKEPLIEVTYD